jgi:hypothetical protein
MLIRGGSAVRRTLLTGHSRLDDYNHVGHNLIKQNGLIVLLLVLSYIYPRGAQLLT